MVLDRYFAAKSRLKPALKTLHALRNHADGGAVSELNRSVAVVEQLPELFRVVVVGVPGCGKSTLINVIKAQSKEKLGMDALEVQGSESAAVHRSALRKADAVICVLDAGEPWCAAMWDYLKALPNAIFEKTLVVVQRSDLRAASELAPVLRHLGEELRRRFGVAPPVVPVSARIAGCAQGDSSIDDKRYRQSGIDKLGDALTRTLSSSSGCLEALKQAAKAGTTALEALRGAMSEVAGEVEKSDAARLGLEQLSESFLAQTRGLLTPAITSLDRAFLEAVERAVQQLLAAPTRLGEHEADAFGTELQAGLVKGIAKANIGAIEEIVSLLENHLDRSWSQVTGYLSEHRDVFKAEDLIEVEWPRQRRAFLAAAAARTAPARKAVRVDEEVSRQLSRPTARRRAALVAGLLLAAGAGVALAFQQWITAGIFGAAVMVPLLAYSRWIKSWRNRLAQSLRDALDSHRKRMGQATADVIKLDTEVYLAEFRGKAAQLCEQAQRIGKNNKPLLSDFSEAETAIAEVRATLNS